MRVVNPIDLDMPPLADVGTDDGVILKGRAAAEPDMLDSRAEPAGAGDGSTLPRPRRGITQVFSGPENAPHEADRMRAAGFRWIRGAWRR